MFTFWDGIVVLAALWIVCHTRVSVIFSRVTLDHPEDEDAP